VVRYSRSLAERVAAGAEQGRFVVVLGGDCSIVLGCLLGARRAAGGRVGLAYVDAHADFATPEESRTGSVASMCLALATGRGDSPLARMAGRTPLVNGRHVALLGRRDMAEPWYGHAALSAFDVLDVPDSRLFANGVGELVSAALTRLAGPGVNGFWIQLDADVLNPAVMPAVDSPERWVSRSLFTIQRWTRIARALVG
jgi:arginase